MPSQDAPIELQNLRLQHPELRAKEGKTLACDLRHAIVIWIGDDVEQSPDTVTTDGSYDAELGDVGADRYDHEDFPGDRVMKRAMEHEAALLFGRLGLHERMFGRVTAW